jgi:hypothetical protein
VWFSGFEVIQKKDAVSGEFKKFAIVDPDRFEVCERSKTQLFEKLKEAGIEYDYFCE